MENQTDKQFQTDVPEKKEKHWLWKKGQSGNPKGRPSFSITALVKEKLQTKPEGMKETYAELLIKRILNKAIKEGNEAMIRNLWQYMDGMPKQSHELTGAQGKPLFLPSELLDKNEINTDTITGSEKPS